MQAPDDPRGDGQGRASLPYRPCVGIVLIGRDGRIFVGERRDTPGAWQMPQGGIDRGETPVEAAFRELEEEVGTRHAALLGETRGWLTYDFPPELHRSRIGRRYRGQRQRWVALRFEGEDHEIDPVHRPHPEFRRWRWATPPEILEAIVPFKAAIYRSVLEAFAPHLVPVGPKIGA